jgi:hypothetical protein
MMKMMTMMTTTMMMMMLMMMLMLMMLRPTAISTPCQTQYHNELKANSPFSNKSSLAALWSNHALCCAVFSIAHTWLIASVSGLRRIFSMSCEKTFRFQSFSRACPEPVLANRQFSA